LKHLWPICTMRRAWRGVDSCVWPAMLRLGLGGPLERSDVDSAFQVVAYSEFRCENGAIEEGSALLTIESGRKGVHLH
jgi:hypothetical protein